MKVKMIAFGDCSDQSYLKLESVITNSFSAITGNDVDYPSVYPTVQSGFPELAGALKTNDMIVLFAAEKIYHEAKRNICKIFKFEMVHSEPVLARLRTLQNSERFMMHALIPKSATPFPLADGLFPGFAVRSKRQCIFFLPLSEDRTFITMKKYVFPYIQYVYGARLPDFSEFEMSFAADILEKQLLLTGAQIAVSNTSVCKYIAHAGKKIECFNDHISYAPYDPKKYDKDVSRLSAVNAAEYYECQFGASIVEGEKDAYGNYTATITISNNSTATIRNMSSVPDESHEDFMKTIVAEFFIMLAQEIASAPPVPAEELKHIKPSPAIHAYRIVLYLILFATAFFFTYVAASFSNLPFFS